jgi:hypothetical protein
MLGKSEGAAAGAAVVRERRVRRVRMMDSMFVRWLFVIGSVLFFRLVVYGCIFAKDYAFV